MKIMRYFFIGLMLLFVLNACSNLTNLETPTPSITPERSPQYPAPQVEMTGNPSYPVPSTAVRNSAGPTFTSDPQMGAVIGRLLLNDSPVKNATLYLAEVIKDASGRDIIAGLDRAKSPTTDSDNQGKFAFINVKTGRYAVILDVITNQYLMNYPSNEKPIIIQVDSGTEVDLGDLDYDSLPLP